jgi:LemA protein
MKRITIASTLTTLLTICFFIIIASGKNCDDCFSTPVMMVKFVASGLVIFIGSIYFTSLYLKNEKCIFDIETQPLLETNEAVDGVPFSVEGKVLQDQDKLLKSPYTGLPCVYYHSITERRVGSGKNRRWEIIENLVDFLPFYISDSRGKIRVDPTNLDADFSGYKITARNRSVPDPENSEIDCLPILKNMHLSEGTDFMGIPVTGELRRNEYILPPDVPVFAYGFVTKDDIGLTLREYPNHPLIISQKTKVAYVDEFYKGRDLVFLVHFLMALGFSIVVLSVNYFLHLDPVIHIVVLVAGNSVLFISILFTVYNRLITLRQRAEFAFNDIDIELKRRAELIPKIVDLVKVYSAYESELQGFIARMRVHTELLKALPEGKKVDIAPLTAIIEKYPDLKANENFTVLMTSLVDTEERIAYARAFYNRNVRKLNTLVLQFPFIVIAYLFDISEMEYLSIVSDQSAPKVELS